MPTFQYSPMLRSKAGEAIALTNLTAAAKNRMMPVIHLVHAPPATFADSVATSWAKRPMALDGTFQCDVTGSTHGFTQMFDHIGKGKVGLIPSIEHSASLSYLAAVQKILNRYAPGVLVKAKLNQLHDAAAWVAAQGWKSSDTDLVVTLGEIGGYDPAMLVPVVTKAISDNIPSPSPWRSVTLSASAAPGDVGQLAPGRNDVPRLDWQVWRDVAPMLKYPLNYADFSSLNPNLTDPPGYVMAKATVSVRYAIDDYWIVIKGKPTTGKTAQKMTSQYRAHAKTLVADPNFGGLVGCWGDGQIQNIAGGSPGAGGRPQWASYAASRHISLVADRLP